MGMRKYEAMFIIRPDLNSEQFSQVTNRIAELIKKHEGQLVSSQVWSENRKLVYPIRSRGAIKQKFDHGTYYLVYFMFSPDKLDALKFDLNLTEEILRWLIIRRSKEDE